jgi:sugar-specific transcriptional regulator TrmB
MRQIARIRKNWRNQMRNTLSDLNNILFEELERIADVESDPEELKNTIQRSDAITKVAEAIIKNGELALKAAKHSDEYGYKRNPIPLIGEVEECGDTQKKLKSS